MSDCPVVMSVLPLFRKLCAAMASICIVEKPSVTLRAGCFIRFPTVNYDNEDDNDDDEDHAENEDHTASN
jgi:hypothetical protein